MGPDLALVLLPVALALAVRPAGTRDMLGVWIAPVTAQLMMTLPLAMRWFPESASLKVA